MVFLPSPCHPNFLYTIWIDKFIILDKDPIEMKSLAYGNQNIGVNKSTSTKN
jgi:hypothetical protein